MGGDKEKVETALTELRESLNGTDTDAIKSATERLSTALQSVSQLLYEQAAQEQQAAAGGAEGAAGAASDDDVVDAEIVDEESA
jgi:molecular chaperone DnaK